MKANQSICPICFDVYPASSAAQDPALCPDCGSEAIDIELVPLGTFLAETSTQKLTELRERWIAATGFLESYKAAKLQRIDAVLALRRSLDAGRAEA
jgi:hypothetical protein